MAVPGLTAACARVELRRAWASTTSRSADLSAGHGWSSRARLRALETVGKVLTASIPGPCPTPVDV